MFIFSTRNYILDAHRTKNGRQKLTMENGIDPQCQFLWPNTEVGLDCAVFYVPTNTVYVIRETVFTGKKTQPTVSKY